jgi:crotonobetainyl-CoA:carnitine CoA-transferase CaiB-like acyl-CoA transferase
MTSLLGDFGADVIKVEPLAGEPFRNIDGGFGHFGSSYFFGMNRSKRSLALDLKRSEGRDILQRLLCTADVFIVSMRPAAVARLGLGYDDVREINDRLIYCALTAFGEDGPIADQPGMDILAQALSGIMGTTGPPSGEPTKVGTAIADFATSFVGCFAICAALLARARDQKGQKISLNLLDTSIALLPNYFTDLFRTGVRQRPMGNAHPQIVPYQTFATADGHIVIACLNDRFWPHLCAALERPDLETDARYRTNQRRVQNRHVLIPVLDEIVRQSSSADWLRRLRRHDVPCSNVNMLEEVFDHPQVQHNRMLLELAHPGVGRYRTTNNPVRMSRTPVQPHGHAPELGEHTEAVLSELGFAPDEIAAFVREQIVARPET